MIDNLTEREEKIILDRRAAEGRKLLHRQRVLNILETALRFEIWKQETGAGATYSTFCDDFGYEGSEDEHRLATYKIVMKIINLVHMKI